MNNETKNLFQPLIDHTVNQAIVAIVGTNAGSLSGSAAMSAGVGESATVEALDENGDAITQWNFMLGVDALGDPNARLRVRGESRDYGF
ncbi:MAG TPA: hypothetical protein VF719_01295 [Abditibacteriaceae bacterium]|jgi:hypothetical protein